MINSVIIPIIKNKSGDLTAKNNYRPIALFSIISKGFVHTIIIRLEEYLWTNDNQFRFKSRHSTDLCIYAITEFINYFQSRSTSVNVAFLDASKAFDKISHLDIILKTYWETCSSVFGCDFVLLVSTPRDDCKMGSLYL